MTDPSPSPWIQGRESKFDTDPMRLLYQLLYGLNLLPVKVLRDLNYTGKTHRGSFKERLGSYGAKLKQAITNRETFWIHIADKHQVNIATHLVRYFEIRAPRIKIVVSTDNSHTMNLIKERMPSYVSKIYFPLDFDRPTKKSLAVVNPRTVIFLNALPVPVFLKHARTRKVPVYLLHAKIDEEQLLDFKKLSAFYRPAWRSFTRIVTQTDEDRDRMKELTGRERRISTGGYWQIMAANLAEKFPMKTTEILMRLGVQDKNQILLAEGTNELEETMIASVFRQLRKHFPKLFLILAPRSSRRSREAAQRLEKEGLILETQSEMTTETYHSEGEIECLVANTAGKGNDFYSIATLVFLGITIHLQPGRRGTQASILGKPILFGPEWEMKRSQVAEELISKGGALRGETGEQLGELMIQLLKSESRRKDLGERAQGVAKSGRSQWETSADTILRRLRRKGMKFQ